MVPACSPASVVDVPRRVVTYLPERLLVIAILPAGSATVHLGLGNPEFVDWFASGGFSILVILFVVSEGVILVGIGPVAAGVLSLRPASALGAGMVLDYLIGYLDWHVF